MIDFDEALKLCLQNTGLGQSQTVSISAALGHVLADPVHANLTQPPFNASAMDGYAVNAGLIKSGTPYPVEFEVAAGNFPQHNLTDGVARIFTGGALPTGADAVIIQENASRDGDTVTFSAEAASGQNVRHSGRDFQKGDLLVDAGTNLTAAHIGLIASANVSHVSVIQKPVVGLLSTGDELKAPGSQLQPGQIVGSNSYLLEALFAPHAKSVRNFGTAPDNPDALETLLQNMLESDADIIVTTGGASVGDHDLLVPTLEKMGATRIFWKIAMRPGKPVLLTKLGEKLIFTLPGNPVSAFVTASTLVMPCIDKFAGKSPLGAYPTARLTVDLPETGPRRHFRRAHLGFDGPGAIITPVQETDSAHQSSLASANALLVQIENEPALEAGTLVSYLPI